MLGETKYFQLIKEEKCVSTYNGSAVPEPEYFIKEAQTNDDGEPILADNAIKEDVWGDEPVTYETEKCGIYWEKKMPLFSKNMVKENGLELGYELLNPGYKELKNGLIRVIGRYWDYEGKTNYKVNLTAKYKGKQKIEIRIIKPKKIGQVHNKTNTFDVEGKPYDLDELIIEKAGQYGVPPQIIKALIKRESDFKNAYRWEPFFEAKYNIHKEGEIWMNSSYRYNILSEIDEGDPSPPYAYHTNIYISANISNAKYWGFQGTIWDLLFKNCKTINPSTTIDLYPLKSWREDARNYYKATYASALSTIYYLPFIDPPREFIPGLSKRTTRDYEEAKNLAREEANILLRDCMYDGRMRYCIAQTRIASSYGVLQPMFTTATEETKMKYPKNNSDYLPENLNTEIVFDYALPYFNRNLQAELKLKESGGQNNWLNGFENTLRIVSNSYNTGWDSYDSNRYRWYNRELRFYGQEIIQLSTIFLPSK